jgi:2'-5' RNA ligase
MHLTLVPPWQEASIPAAVDRLQFVAHASRAFQLTFRHIGYGPYPVRPRLLWVDCALCENLAALRTAFLQAYGQTDERPFRPHVTLARIRGNGQRIARTHPVDQPLSLAQSIETAELFCSPRQGGSGYRIIASARLGKFEHAGPTASSFP